MFVFIRCSSVSSSASFTSFTSPKHIEHTASTPEPVKYPSHRSLLFLSEGDSLTYKLVEYFHRLTKVNPTKAGQFVKCLKTLRKDDTVFRTIKNISNDSF